MKPLFKEELWDTCFSGGSIFIASATGKWLKRISKHYPVVDRKKQRDRIVAHRNKKTLIVPPDMRTSDSTQVLYFSAKNNGFVPGSKI